jgi:hypothetical protein
MIPFCCCLGLGDNKEADFEFDWTGVAELSVTE